MRFVLSLYKSELWERQHNELCVGWVKPANNQSTVQAKIGADLPLDAVVSMFYRTL